MDAMYFKVPDAHSLKAVSFSLSISSYVKPLQLSVAFPPTNSLLTSFLRYCTSFQTCSRSPT